MSNDNRKTLADVVKAPFPTTTSGRRRVFLDGLDMLLDLYRGEGMTDLELRDALRVKIVEINEAREDAA